MARSKVVKPGMLEISLHQDGVCWVASGAGLCVKARSLQTLDQCLRGELLAAGFDLPVDVSMYFERDSLPHWMRQYAAHYFNRQVRLEYPSTPGGSS